MKNKPTLQTMNSTMAAPLNSTGVGLEANFDTQTQLAYRYRSINVYASLERSGFKFQVLSGRQDVSATAPSAAQKSKSDYITGCGHGQEDTFLGYQQDPIFVAQQYAPENVKNKVIHFLSCRNAQKLGPDFVTNGCKAFFGYCDDFIFCLGSEDIFFECDAQIDLCFAVGLTAEEVHDSVIKVFNKYIKQFESNHQFDEQAALSFDRDILCSPVTDSKWGSKSARLESPSLWRRSLNWIAEKIEPSPKSRMVKKLVP